MSVGRVSDGCWMGVGVFRKGVGWVSDGHMGCPLGSHCTAMDGSITGQDCKGHCTGLAGRFL